jgi:hypothetical protein
MAILTRPSAIVDKDIPRPSTNTTQLRATFRTATLTQPTTIASFFSSPSGPLVLFQALLSALRRRRARRPIARRGKNCVARQLRRSLVHHLAGPVGLNSVRSRFLRALSDAAGGVLTPVDRNVCCGISREHAVGG